MDDTILKRIYKRKDDIILRSIAGEMILVPIRGSLADMQKIFSLNSVGEYIWNACDGSKSVQQISEDVRSLFDVTEEEAIADLDAFINELLREGLVGEAS